MKVTIILAAFIMCLIFMSATIVKAIAPPGPPFSEGYLIAREGVEGAAIYYIANDQKKYIFPDEKTYFTWYNDFSKVRRVSLEDLDYHEDGGAMPYRQGTRLITTVDTAKIYAVGLEGDLYWIPSEEVAIDLYGENWASLVQDIIPGYFSSTYNVVGELSTTLPNSTLVKESNNNDTYVVIDGNKSKLDDEVMIAFHLNKDFIIKLDNLSRYVEVEPTTTFTTKKLFRFDPADYH